MLVPPGSLKGTVRSNCNGKCTGNNKQKIEGLLNSNNLPHLSNVLTCKFLVVLPVSYTLSWNLNDHCFVSVFVLHTQKHMFFPEEMPLCLITSILFSIHFLFVCLPIPTQWKKIRTGNPTCETVRVEMHVCETRCMKGCMILGV